MCVQILEQINFDILLLDIPSNAQSILLKIYKLYVQLRMKYMPQMDVAGEGTQTTYRKVNNSACINIYDV